MKDLSCWLLAGLVVSSVFSQVEQDGIVNGIESAEKALPEVEIASTLEMEPYRFEPQKGDAVDAELGKFRVPENRHDPNSREIELAFVRFPATTPNPGAPIVYLAGGPGGSGVATARGRRFPLFMALRQLGDVIALDQRGTGLSNTIPFCEAPEPWPLEKPSNRDQTLAWLESTARHCAKFWRGEGVDLDGYNTEQSADDLEDLRRELGVDKLRLWSISYGTHLAFSAVRRHGDRIERVVLASAEGPDQTVKLPSRTEAFLGRILSEEDRRKLRHVLDRLDAEPIVVEAVHPRTQAKARVGVGKLDVQIILGFMIKNPDTQQALPMWIDAMDRGDFSPIAPYLLMMAGQLRGLSGMSEAMDAASGISPGRRQRILREMPGTLLEDALNFPGDALAGPLGITDLGDDFRGPLKSSVPALFLSGDLDGRTYLESHRELAAGFSNGTHVVVEGAGHDLFMSALEVSERILAFMAGREVSADPIRVP